MLVIFLPVKADELMEGGEASQQEALDLLLLHAQEMGDSPGGEFLRRQSNLYSLRVKSVRMLCLISPVLAGKGL